MRRLVFDAALVQGEDICLSEEQSHYLIDVMRMGPTTQFIALDPGGNAYIAELVSKTTCRILEPAQEEKREPTLYTSLFVPLLKGDKLDLVVQKAVELGVAEINLYKAQRSIVKGTNLDKKILRLQKIAHEATRQSRRHIVPKIQGLFSIDEVCLATPGIFAWEEESKLGLSTFLQSQSSEQLSLLTGPEGGLSKAEADLLLAANWRSVSLGPRILRAETAAITLLACTMFASGEMG